MAIYKLSVRTVSRGTGGSAVAAAAYQRRTGMYLEREDLSFNFSAQRADLVRAEMIGACGRTPEQIWNQAEWAERQWNGVVAREFIVALPRELTQEQQWEPLERFGRWLNGEYRGAVDIAHHVPEIGGKRLERNPHGHLLLTTREVMSQGFGEKIRILDDYATSRGQLFRIRKAWGEAANVALEKAGIPDRVTHLPEEVLEGGRIPTRHVGRRATAMERDGVATAVGDHNRQAKLVNEVREVLGAGYGKVPRSRELVLRDLIAMKEEHWDLIVLSRAVQDGRASLSSAEREAMGSLLSQMARLTKALEVEIAPLDRAARVERELKIRERGSRAGKSRGLDF